MKIINVRLNKIRVVRMYYKKYLNFGVVPKFFFSVFSFDFSLLDRRGNMMIDLPLS